MKKYSSKEVIPLSELSYFRERTKTAVFNLILTQFEHKAETEGLTKKQLADKLRQDKALITRWLANPSNMTLEKVSDLLLAMGAEMKPRAISLTESHTEKVDSHVWRGSFENSTAGVASSVQTKFASSEATA